MQMRLALHEDRDAIWRILQPMIRVGETYALPSDMSEADAIAYWMGDDRETFVAGKLRLDPHRYRDRGLHGTWSSMSPGGSGDGGNRRKSAFHRRNPSSIPGGNPSGTALSPCRFVGCLPTE
jgi:hypothetical protein